ncbi:MAG: DUF1598 domain-containing protein, partial [Planctomycetaceae bacterium]|nr:DUF1598 domain-containing protein [Planctomycetaceae bacterium]
QVAKPSPLRKISLNRLEKAIEAKLANHGRLPDEMRYLAGLTRLSYVFFYPETNDIVIAGPAEGWAEDATGRVVSLSKGQPVLELQDLVTALRAYPPHAKGAKVIGCSIDPTKEGLAKMQQFIQFASANASPDDADKIVDGIRNSLGLQNVTVLGVPENTHFAQVLVEADYRMKLIGIGIERPPVKLASYVDRADPKDIASNAMQRWYFLPDYQCVRTSDDGLAMELVGDGVKLIGSDEMVERNGGRRVSGRPDKASQSFVAAFTKSYSQLAAKSPVYAQLRDLIDMSVAAAFIQAHDYYGKAGWSMPFLGSEEKFPVGTYNTPKTVETACTSVWKGAQLMTPVGGGVHIEPKQALDSNNLLPDDGGKVSAERAKIKLELAEGQWWWD